MGAADVTTRNFFPKLQRNVTSTTSGSQVVSYTSDLGNNKPILTLIHGYPQSAFEWREVAPLLADKASLFIPELPGYGISTPTKGQSRIDIGGALLEALTKVFNISEDSPRKVILGGHDRGARICHRLAVSRKKFPALDVIGAILMDIVPTKIQWDKFQDPAICSGYFHWPLLANVDMAKKLLTAYGGGNWVREMHQRIAGNELGLERIKSQDAVEVYAALFDKEQTLHYSCEDYANGASPEYHDQAEDQKAGRKIEVPTLVMFSKAKLGSRIDVAKEWQDWIAPGVAYEGIPIGSGFGHYLPEEAYDIVTDHIVGFLKQHI